MKKEDNDSKLAELLNAFKKKKSLLKKKTIGE